LNLAMSELAEGSPRPRFEKEDLVTGQDLRKEVLKNVLLTGERDLEDKPKKYQKSKRQRIFLKFY